MGDMRDLTERAHVEEEEEEEPRVALPPRHALRMIAANHPPARLPFALPIMAYRECWTWHSKEIVREYHCRGAARFDGIRLAY